MQLLNAFGTNNMSYKTPKDHYLESAAKSTYDKFLARQAAKLAIEKRSQQEKQANENQEENAQEMEIEKDTQIDIQEDLQEKQTQRRIQEEEDIDLFSGSEFDESSDSEADQSIIKKVVQGEPRKKLVQNTNSDSSISEVKETPKKKRKTGKNKANKKKPSNKKKTSKKGRVTVSKPIQDEQNEKERTRRTCRRKVSGNAPTPEKSNRNFTGHKEKTRLTLMMPMQGSMNPSEKLVERFKEFANEIFRADKTSALLPWRGTDFSAGKIGAKTAFPTLLPQLQLYAPRMYAGQQLQDRKVWTQVYIGHDKSIEQIIDYVRPWLITGGNVLFKNMLQVEEKEVIGFLVYSTREMDASALADEIGIKLKIKVALTWRPIDNGNKNLPKNQKVYALHVDIDARTITKDKTVMMQTYGRSSKPSEQYPNGIRLRFVTSRDKVINVNERKKIENLRIRQRQFLNTIRTQTTYDILELDRPAGQGKPTLRQMLMSLKCSENNEVPLFHCIDLDYKMQGYIMQYSESNSVEAECVINAIIPYVKHFYADVDVDDVLTEWFDPVAIDRCENLEYNQDQGMVVDKKGDMVTSIELLDGDELAGFDFSQLEKGNESDDDTISRPNMAAAMLKRGPAVGPYDDDDNSTVRTSGGKSRVTKTPTSQVGKDRANISVGSNISVLSDGSYKTFKTNISASVGQLQSQINDQNMLIESKFGKLTAMFTMIQTQLGENRSASTKVDVPNMDQTKAGRSETDTSGAS